jgi:hypothetical protein
LAAFPAIFRLSIRKLAVQDVALYFPHFRGIFKCQITPETMSSLQELCEEHFGSSDIYGVLGIDSTATEKEGEFIMSRFELLVES